MTLADSTHSGSEHEAKGDPHGPNGGSASHEAGGAEAKKDVRAAWRVVRSLPRTLQSALKTHPAAVLAGAGAAGFVVGALCGSRVGRLLTTTLVGYGMRRVIEGPVAREVARYATQVMRRAEANG